MCVCVRQNVQKLSQPTGGTELDRELDQDLDLWRQLLKVIAKLKAPPLSIELQLQYTSPHRNNKNKTAMHSPALQHQQQPHPKFDGHLQAHRLATSAINALVWEEKRTGEQEYASLNRVAPTSSTTNGSSQHLPTTAEAASAHDFPTPQRELDFRACYQMPLQMRQHWTRPSKHGEVSFADFVRTSPSDIAGVVVSTFTISMYVA